MSAAVLPIMDASVPPRVDNYYHAHRSRGFTHATAATRRMPTDDSPSVRILYVLENDALSKRLLTRFHTSEVLIYAKSASRLRVGHTER